MTNSGLDSKPSSGGRSEDDIAHALKEPADEMSAWVIVNPEHDMSSLRSRDPAAKRRSTRGGKGPTSSPDALAGPVEGAPQAASNEDDIAAKILPVGHGGDQGEKRASSAYGPFAPDSTRGTRVMLPRGRSQGPGWRVGQRRLLGTGAAERKDLKRQFEFDEDMEAVVMPEVKATGYFASDGIWVDLRDNGCSRININRRA